MPQVQSPASFTRPLDPRVCDRLARAQREHYRIGVCAGCGGPEVFAKTKPAASCLRCGRFRVLSAIAPSAKARRCLGCRHLFYSVTNYQQCEKCRAKSGATRPAKASGLRTSVTPKTSPVLRADLEAVLRSPDPATKAEHLRGTPGDPDGEIFQVDLPANQLGPGWRKRVG